MPIIIKYVHKERLSSYRIDKKVVNNSRYIEVLSECESEYLRFLNEFRGFVVNGDEINEVDCLNRYLSFAKEKENSNAFLASKTKYYSSILEEMPVILLEDHIGKMIVKYGLEDKALQLGGIDCVIRIAANPDGTPFYERKRIDFALAVDAIGDGNWIPLVGYETKKYMDKTMFGTVLETYKSLQVFRPRTFYGFIVEDEARSKDVVINSLIHKNEHILSGSNRERQNRNNILRGKYSLFKHQLFEEIDFGLRSLLIKE